MYPIETFYLKPPLLLLPVTTLHLSRPINSINPRTRIVFPNKPRRRCRIRASSAESAEIDMFRNREGVYVPNKNKVVVLWDLDNKPPRGPPYLAAMGLKQVAQRFGDVVDMCAYANRHAFIHLPNWVREERRDRKQVDILERKGVVKPAEPYVCGVCGRKCKTNLDRKKHFKQLHERERQKKLNRMRSLKGKKRQKFKERYISGNEKYNEAARTLITPKVGYGLAAELRRAGVFVKTVADKPQAADWAVKRQIEHSMTRGIDWLVLVSDDSDFSNMLRKAREGNLRTIVVGDVDRALGKEADLWVPWIGVQNGELKEEDLVPNRRRRSEFSDDGSFTVSNCDGDFIVEDSLDTDLPMDRNLDGVIEDIVGIRIEFNGERVSAFSEGEEEEEEGDDTDYIFEDSDDDDDDDDGYF